MSTRYTPFPHRNLPQLLLQARELVMLRFRPLIAAEGITDQQWRIIRLLDERGPLEPRDIGDLCQISSPSMTGVLARMENFGQVTRRRMDHDRRRLLVSLTPKGRAIAGRVAPAAEAAYRRLESELGKEFVDRLYCVLDELIASLDAVHADTA